MNQKNNNNEENILDVDKLYDIASRLKEAKSNRISAKSILAKNPSSTINKRYIDAKEEYGKALNDFNNFVNNYIEINPDGINQIIFDKGVNDETVIRIIKKVKEELEKIKGEN